MSYKLIVHRQAQKKLLKLPIIVIENAEKAIDNLIGNPFQMVIKNLKDIRVIGLKLKNVTGLG
jgi:mRNA-degrading endonuclease RelE of RelBE toxin-antitoxin system